MQTRLQPQTQGYLVAVFLAVVAFGLGVVLESPIGPEALLLWMLFPVAAAASTGGHKPGILATVLGGAVVASFVLKRPNPISLADLSFTSQLVGFVMIGLWISWMYRPHRTGQSDLSTEQQNPTGNTSQAETWKARYEAAVLSSGSILYDSSRDMRDVIYGGACEQILGYTPEELNGDIQKWIALIHPEDRELFLHEVERTSADQSPYHADYRMVRKDGTTVWLRDNGHFTVKDANGQFERIVGLVKDVTRQREDEQQLAWVSQRLSTLVENTPLAVVEWDSSFFITRWSAGAQRTFGWSASEVIGKNLSNVPFLTDEGFHHFANSIQSLGNSQESFTVFTGANVCQDQDSIICQWHNSVLRDEEGRMIAVLSLVLDITEQTKAEADLRASEELFRQLTDAMPQVVWMATDDGTVDHYNSRISNFAGASRNEDGSWSWNMVLHPEDRQHTEQAWTEAVKNRTLYQCEHRVHMLDGSIRWHLSRGVPVTSVDTGKTRWFGSATDIHDLKVSQEALRESENRFRAFMDNNPACAYLKDEDGKYLFVNRMLEQTTGRPYDKWIGKRDEELSDGKNSITQACACGLHAESKFTSQSRIESEVTVNVGGHERHFLTFSFPVQGYEGRPMTGGISLDITDRKVAELQAEAERERSQLLADAVPALISYVNKDAQYGLVNHAYEVWFDQNRDQIIGRGLKAFLGPAAWAAISPYVAEALTGRLVSYEAKIPYRNGSYRWISATYTPAISKDGSVRGFVAHVNDITARHRAEEELNYQRSLLQAITDNAQTSIFLIGEDGRTLFVNPAAEAMTGYCADELIGRYFCEVIQCVSPTHPDELRHGRPALGQGAYAEPIRNQADLLIHRDGHSYPVRWNARSVYRDGESSATVAEIWDVTKERQAEQDLKAATQFLETIIETAPTLVVVVNSKAEICMFNRVCEMLTGYEREEVLGRNMLDLFVADPDRETFAQRFNSAEVAELCQPHENHWTTKSGVQRLIEWRCTRLNPVGDHDEPMMLAIGVDVTDRRLMEDELRDQAERLAETDRRKDEFIATLAHELRNPLAPIRMGLELIKMVGPDITALENTRVMMERQTLQLITLVDDLLDVSRITRGKLDIRRTVVELSDVVQSAVESCRPGLFDAGHDLHVTIPKEKIYLEADPNRLAQVLANLLNNAVKYTPPGGRIDMVVNQTDDRVCFIVQDNGIGIPLESQQRIFEMFSQIDRSIEQGCTGLGIGLTLVKSLVEMHGGTIDVYSEGVDRGSRFTITIPIQKHLRPPHETHSGAITIKQQGPCRVVIVDDNQAAVDALSQVVQRLGHDVRIASNGQQAIEISEAFLPHAIVMDIGMPRMDGHTAARAIRKQPWGQNTLLVALTGWGQDEDRRRTIESGFDHHLVKPADPSCIAQLLSTIAPQTKASVDNCNDITSIATDLKPRFAD